MRGEIRASTSDIRVIGIFEMLYLEGTTGEIVTTLKKSLDSRVCILATKLRDLRLNTFPKVS